MRRCVVEVQQWTDRRVSAITHRALNQIRAAADLSNTSETNFLIKVPSKNEETPAFYSETKYIYWSKTLIFFQVFKKMPPLSLRHSLGDSKMYVLHQIRQTLKTKQRTHHSWFSSSAPLPSPFLHLWGLEGNVWICEQQEGEKKFISSSHDLHHPPHTNVSKCKPWQETVPQ